MRFAVALQSWIASGRLRYAPETSAGMDREPEKTRVLRNRNRGAMPPHPVRNQRLMIPSGRLEPQAGIPIGLYGVAPLIAAGHP